MEYVPPELCALGRCTETLFLAGTVNRKVRACSPRLYVRSNESAHTTCILGGKTLLAIYLRRVGFPVPRIQATAEAQPRQPRKAFFSPTALAI